MLLLIIIYIENAHRDFKSDCSLMAVIVFYCSQENSFVMSSVDTTDSLSDKTKEAIQCEKTASCLEDESQLNDEYPATKPDNTCQIEFELPDIDDRLVSESSSQKNDDCSGGESDIQETREALNDLSVSSSSSISRHMQFVKIVRAMLSFAAVNKVPVLLLQFPN